MILHALDSRLLELSESRLKKQERSHQYALCLKDVKDTSQAEKGNETITIEEIEQFGCCETWTPDFWDLERQGQKVIIKQQR